MANQYPPSEGQQIATTLISLGTQGLRLVSDRPKGSDFETLPRFPQRPRYRQGGLVPWQPKSKERALMDDLVLTTA